MSNKHRGDKFTQQVQNYFKTKGINLEPEYKVSVGLSTKYKKQHAFDLGNADMLVECKCYDWTEGNNNPSAKLSTLNEAMLYLFTASKRCKMVFMKQTSRKGKHSETLAGYYVRLHRPFIPDDVEIWEFNETNGDANKIWN